MSEYPIQGKFKVLAAKKLSEKDTDYGPKQVIKLRLQDYRNEAVYHDCEWFTSTKTPVPSEGDELEGEIFETRYGLKFKMQPKKQGGWKGKGGRSEAGEKRMNRASAQKQACQIVEAHGTVPDETTMRNLINWFENDIYGKKVNSVEGWLNTSDVPGLFDG